MNKLTILPMEHCAARRRRLNGFDHLLLCSIYSKIHYCINYKISCKKFGDRMGRESNKHKLLIVQIFLLLLDGNRNEVFRRKCFIVKNCFVHPFSLLKLLALWPIFYPKLAALHQSGKGWGLLSPVANNPSAKLPPHLRRGNFQSGFQDKFIRCRWHWTWGKSAEAGRGAYLSAGTHSFAMLN
jgi:hypothetical protein